jgi:transcriptional regulator with XRE-family HTH domain
VFIPGSGAFGQRLKEYRQHRGMTVRELADAAHVTPGQISRYEHGRDRISHERVTEFARILRIKSNDLYEPPGSRLRQQIDERLDQWGQAIAETAGEAHCEHAQKVDREFDLLRRELKQMERELTELRERVAATAGGEK